MVMPRFADDIAHVVRVNPIPWLFAPGIALAGYLVGGVRGAVQALAGWAVIVTAATIWVTAALGMGIATGIAFDREENLYVGDRSGTIFKIARDRQIFVFATLEASVPMLLMRWACSNCCRNRSVSVA